MGLVSSSWMGPSESLLVAYHVLVRFRLWLMTDTDVTRYWFKPLDDSAQSLAARVVAAGHRQVVVRDGLVGLVPMPETPVYTTWGQIERWLGSLQNHFGCEFVESA